MSPERVRSERRRKVIPWAQAEDGNGVGTDSGKSDLQLHSGVLSCGQTMPSQLSLLCDNSSPEY